MLRDFDVCAQSTRRQFPVSRNRPTKTNQFPCLAALLALLACPPAVAAGGVSEGEKLVAEKHCEACHNNKTYGDASAVYLRKDRKVTSLEKLRAQVALCNSELGLQLFPEEEEQVATFLDSRYYHFSRK